MSLTLGDFTVRDGAADAAVGNMGGYAQRLAYEWRLPYVRTFEQIGRTYVPVSSSTPGIKQLLCTVPVVKAALGYDITKEELGDERTQIYEAGVIDNLAESEPEAYEMIRRFFSYLPANVWQLPPRGEIPGDSQRRAT